MKRLYYSVEAHMDIDSKIYKDIDNLENMTEDEIISIIVDELIDSGRLNIKWEVRNEKEM